MTSIAQKEELFRTIWKLAEDMRNKVDGWDFKSYVLGMLFYRFISENFADYVNRLVRESDPAFEYHDLPDEEAEMIRAQMIGEKGFFIFPSQLFENVRKRAPKDEHLNETLQRVFREIEASAVGSASESDFKGLFDDLDVNSNKLGTSILERNKHLVQILNTIGGHSGGDNGFQNLDIDLFGDAYEYLMAMYAGAAGKSGGEFFTPQEVSNLLARIVIGDKKSVKRVYDPACGSGSLLLQFAKQLGKDNVREGFFGQEINITTYNLARINMFLHDIGFEKFDIALGDTLLAPKHWDWEPFDAIVSNPPYSTKWPGKSNPLLINDPRFAPAGALAPESKADLAFTMHMLSWLSTDGTAAIVEFPGVLYRSGAEQKIRKYLIDENVVEAVIQLPANLFFGVTIATCIIVLSKHKADNRTLFVDASAEFVKATNKNRLSPSNIDRIYTVIHSREEIRHFSRLAAYGEIKANDYNLSVSSYVEPEDTREKVDIEALNAEIKAIVSRSEALRASIDEIISELSI